MIPNHRSTGGGLEDTRFRLRAQQALGGLKSSMSRQWEQFVLRAIHEKWWHATDEFKCPCRTCQRARAGLG